MEVGLYGYSKCGHPFNGCPHLLYGLFLYLSKVTNFVPEIFKSAVSSVSISFSV